MRRACSRCGRLRPCPVHPRRNGSTRQYRKARAETLERDRGLCQLRLPGCTVIAEVTDHTVAKIHGGDDTTANLAAACRHCNQTKGDA